MELSGFFILVLGLCNHFVAGDDCGGVRDIDCYDFEFHGDVSNALKGKECKTWTRNGWTDNKCRNDGYHRPWCYRKSGGWDYCDVRQCKECDKKESCQPVRGINWPGNDINPDTANSWDKKDTFEECRTLCEQTSGCNFYTWNKSEKGCWLKSKRSRTRSNGASFVSGLPCKKCEPESCRKPNVPDPALCGIRDIDCYEFEYHGDVNTAKNGAECKPWTMNGWTDNKCRNDGYDKPWCYRKSGGWDYCPIRKCEECDKESCEPVKGIDSPGYDINPDTAETWDKKETFEECRTLCEETSGCNFYTWDNSEKACWLKSKRSKTRSNGAQFVSGLPCKKCEPEFCRKPNAPDPALCGIRDIDCSDFEYHGDVNTAKNGAECKPWTRNGWTDNKCRTDGYHKPWCYKKSGGWDYCDIRKCEECDKEESCLPIMGINWKGVDINPDSATKWDKRDTHEECKTLCEETSGCNFYTWVKDDGCWLKSERGKTRSNGAEYVSGIPCKKCKSDSCKKPNVMDSKTFNMLRNKYLALNKNDKKSYLKGVRELLPQLLRGGDLSSEDIGIAKAVTDSKYPLALIKGKTVNRIKSKVVSINGTMNKYIGKRPYSRARYRQTGLAIAPGDSATITIPEDLVNKLVVTIGDGFHYVNFGLIDKATFRIGSPYGGLITLKMDSIDATTKKGMFDVTIENALEGPNFVYGKSTNEDWNRMKHLAVPWTTLNVPGQILIWIPTHLLTSVTNMTGIMADVKKTMDVYDEMLGIPAGSRPGQETVTYEPNKGGGGYTWVYMVYGYVLCNGGGSSVVGWPYYERLINNFNSPVVFHELGHRGCYPDLPGSGGQWNAEIVRKYIEIKRGLVNHDSWATPWYVLMEYMVGFKMFSKGRPCYEAYREKHFPKGIPYTVNSYQNCWTVIYRFPLFEFGWDTLRKIYSMNADEKKYSDIKYKSMAVKSERLVDLYCTATQHNMLPFFNFFNINVSASVAKSCQAKPLPKVLTGFLKVANCIADKETKDIECTKMPEFPDSKGVCFLSGVCQKDPANGNTATTFDDKIDVFGDKKTRDNEKDCHDRASAIFMKCGNDVKNPITATYRLKNGASTKKTVPTYPLPTGNCYHNNPGPTPHYVGGSSTMVASECNKKCADKNYSYFGLKWSKECWCGNEAPNPGLKLDMTKCYKMCTGNPSLRCGGAHTVNAWKVCKEKNCKFSYE